MLMLSRICGRKTMNEECAHASLPGGWVVLRLRDVDTDPRLQTSRRDWPRMQGRSRAFDRNPIQGSEIA